jgi:thiamine biosynthesis lipoprotein
MEERMRADESRFRVMGCEAHVLVVGSNRREPRRVQRLLERLELMWSRFVPESDISKMNRARGSAVTVHPETLRLLEAAGRGFDMTGGRFDPTVLASVEALGYAGSLDEGMPSAWVAPPVPSRGFGAIHVEEHRRLARLDAGVGFDPGGVGKGLAADMAVEHLMGRGASGALVSIGGDLAVAGEPPQGGPWAISVEDPLDHARDMVVLHLPAGGVATSSARHGRWVTPDGPAPHVIDPATGATIGPSVTSVTVAADEASIAEVVATAALVAGPEDGLSLIEHLGMVGLMVDESGGVRHTRNLMVPA